MTVSASNVGAGRIAVIFEDRANNPAFGQALSHHPNFEYPEVADGLKVNLDIVPEQHQLPSTLQKSSKLHFGEQLLTLDYDTQTRQGIVEPYGAKVSYPAGMSGDKLFNRIKTVLAPKVYNKVVFDQDAELANVMQGTGSAGRAQDATIVDLTGEELNDDASDVLGILEDAKNDLAGGRTVLYLSNDNMQSLLSHPAIVQSVIKADVTRAEVEPEALRQYLMMRFGFADVMYGLQRQQSGSQYQALNRTFQMTATMCMFNIGALAAIRFGGDQDNAMGPREWFDETTRSWWLSYADWRAISVTDPAQVIAFTNTRT